MKMRLVVLAASGVLGLSGVVGLSTAPPARADVPTDIATSIAGELAKQGVKAAIAQFAPGLAKALDPGSAQLEAIRSQLAALDAKVTQLVQHQERLEARLNCAIQRTGHLATIVSRAQTSLQTLVDASRLSDVGGRTRRLDSLYREYNVLTTDQRDLHNRIMDGALIACAEHIERGMEPWLTSQLAPAVRDFYATYRTAAVSLLVVRTNIIALHPAEFDGVATDGSHAVAATVRTVNAWIASEEALIKPALSASESYDVRTRLLYKTAVISGFPNPPLVNQLLSAGWYVSGETTIPTCGVFINLLAETGFTGLRARQELQRRNVLHAPAEISCFDDHDARYYFDLDRSIYIRPSLHQLRPYHRIAIHVGFPQVSQFSYTQK
jgi:hypothetical protein